MFKKFRKNEKGFTLAELLIVVAIIGVLVAISIPIFTAQLEKSRDAVTASNVRAAYAEASAAKLTAAGDGANVKYNSDGTVTVEKIAVKGQSNTNNAFGKAGGTDGLGAVASQFDLPFTLGNGVASKLDGPADDNVTLVFSWATNGTCTANLPTGH